MSIYLPRASARIRPDSSRCSKELLLNRLTEMTQISSLLSVFSEADVLTLRLLLNVLRILQRVPQSFQVQKLVTELELIPIQVRKVNKPYCPPYVFICDGTVIRNNHGAITDIIEIVPVMQAPDFLD